MLFVWDEGQYKFLIFIENYFAAFLRTFIFALHLWNTGLRSGGKFELWCNGSTTDFGSVC